MSTPYVPYEYGVQRYRPGPGETTVEVIERKVDAETVARDWAISPLRTGPRQAHLVRRRGTGSWEIVATWSSPEWPR